MMHEAVTVRREVAEWLDGMFEAKRFGRFSVEITFRIKNTRRGFCRTSSLNAGLLTSST